MKRNIYFALTAIILSVVSATADDKPRTITTRDNQKYEQAIITGKDDEHITITYGAGIVRIENENLPADIQREIGYVTKAEKEKAANADQKAKADITAHIAYSKATAEKAEAESNKKLNKMLKNLPTPSQIEANALSGMPVSDFAAKYGPPINVKSDTDGDDKPYSIYDYGDDIGTALTVVDGIIIWGYFKNVLIINQTQRLKREKAERDERFMDILDKL